MSPIIGIAPCRSLPDYVESIRRVGGEPRVLDPLKDQPEQVVSELDGVLMTGGVDIDPARYGEERHELVTAVEPDRDAFEFALLAAARAARLPLFGICRGLQVMNVALGGSLIQDIAAQMAGILPHTVPAPPFALAHEVWVSPASRLWNLMQEKMVDGETISVNSRHHQAIKRLAPGFEVTATAPDGVIEAIECPNATFCLGVQWHPENFWRTGEFRPLFEGFIEACRK
jgi:putative glutamine amidotransferase